MISEGSPYSTEQKTGVTYSNRCRLDAAALTHIHTYYMYYTDATHVKVSFIPYEAHQPKFSL